MKLEKSVFEKTSVPFLYTMNTWSLVNTGRGVSKYVTDNEINILSPTETLERLSRIHVFERVHSKHFMSDFITIL